jgi:hypothetical protein
MAKYAAKKRKTRLKNATKQLNHANFASFCVARLSLQRAWAASEHYETQGSTMKNARDVFHRGSPP